MFDGVSNNHLAMKDKDEIHIKEEISIGPTRMSGVLLDIRDGH